MEKLLNKLLTILLTFSTLSLSSQSYVEYMQQGKIYYTQKKFLEAYDRFNQAFILTNSEIDKKDCETWKTNSFKNLQKQNFEISETIKANDAELTKSRYILETLYFYDNRIGLAYKDYKYGYIDKNGKCLIPFKYDEASQFDPFSGFARVSTNGDQYLIDSLGNEYPLATSSTGINGNTVALDLRNQQLSSIPPQVFNCYNLKVLLLGHNQLNSIPADISKLRNLIFLDLSNNKILNLSEAIGSLQYLKFLSLSGNQLAKLPETFSKLQSLEELKLSGNNIFILPLEFGNLHQLKYLNLDNNKLKSISTDVCKLYSLKTLSIQNNQIETIAAEIGNLNIIETIYLNENNITDLPTSMERMREVKKLYLTRNKLVNIPIELKKMAKLMEFDLRGNRIPEEKKGLIKSWFVSCNVQI